MDGAQLLKARMGRKEGPSILLYNDVTLLSPRDACMRPCHRFVLLLFSLRDGLLLFFTDRLTDSLLSEWNSEIWEMMVKRIELLETSCRGPASSTTCTTNSERKKANTFGYTHRFLTQDLVRPRSEHSFEVRGIGH